MQIRSTIINRPIKKAQAELTPAGQLAADLEQGIADRVELGKENTTIDKYIAKREFAAKAFLYGSFAAVGTLIMAGQAPPSVVGAGMATAAGLGVYVALNQTLHQDSGTVEINRDGETRTTRYYRNTESYNKTVEEYRSALHIDGTLGERFTASTEALGDIENIAIPKSLEQEKSTLKELASKRKLVADLGQKSRYGYPALSLVDGGLAAKLMAAEKDVFAVAGETSDTKHSLQISAYNKRSTRRAGQVETYIDRTFDYQLKKIEKPSDLQSLPSGNGLPQGVLGVYKDQSSCTVTVGTDEQYGYGGDHGDRVIKKASHSRQTRASELDLGPENAAKIVTKRSVNVREPITMLGVVAGMGTAMRVAPGIPGAALMGGIIGGVLGRELGSVLQNQA